jgi:dolichol-phosphate mannosyltransferase
LKTVSVIVPVFFNEESLPHLFGALREIESQLQTRGAAMQLIFVDDGSGDQSMSRLRQIKAERPETTIIKLTRNFGAVHATKTGIRFVTGDCFVVLAADLQDPPSLIVEMFDRWVAGSKYVVCARSHREDPVSSRLFSSVYYRLIRALVARDYPPGGYDMALMDRAFLPHLVESSKNINTPLFAYWLGFKPDVIEYVRGKREHGKSRWSFGKRIKFFLDSLLGFSILPIRIITGIGTVVSLISFVYGTLIVINALRGKVAVAGFATLTSLMAFLCGLIIIMLGVIGEYIWRIFDEVNRRPETVIDEVL